MTNSDETTMVKAAEVPVVPDTPFTHRDETPMSPHGAAPIFGHYGEKPRWRGRIHQAAFFVSIPAGLWLMSIADTTAAKVSVAIYWVSLAGLFGTSSSYHLYAYSAGAVKWMRRADHSMIFVLIAGTYTPFCLVVLPPSWGIPMLAGLWTIAVVGIAMKMVRIGTDKNQKSGSWLYIVMGWTALAALPKLVSELGWARMGLLFAGGILYSIGAAIMGTKKMNVRPASFGYHEVWHAMTVAASACHFALVAMVIR